MTNAFVSVASSAAPQAAHPVTIDFSQLDLVIGVAAGVVLVLGLGFLVMWALIKAGAIRFGGVERPEKVPKGPSVPWPINGAMPPGVMPLQMCPQTCVEHGTERERSLRNQENIDKLWLELKGIRNEMGQKIDGGFQAMLRNQAQLLAIFADANLVPKNAVVKFMADKE